MLRAEKITLIRGHTPVIRRLSFALAAGEALQLLGSNGAGKTTLLQALAGLLPLRAGCITRPSALLYLGHRPGVKATLTVCENLELAAQLYHGMRAGPALTARVDFALAQVGLTAQKQRQTRFLSAGQQRRCQLARLWLETPPLWLLDEPLTALDVQGAERLVLRCKEHLEGGGSVVFSSHQPFIIPQHPTRTLMLSSEASHVSAPH